MRPIPSYLYQRGHIFWYRQRLTISGINNTLRVSLRTSDPLTARTLALLIANFINRQTAGLSSRFLKSLLVATESGPQVTSEPVGLESPCPETMVLSTTEETEMTSRYEILKNQTQLIIHHYHQMELADWQSQPRSEGEYVKWVNLLCLFKSVTNEAAKLNDLRQSERLVNDFYTDTQSPLPSAEDIAPIVRSVCDCLPNIYQALLDNQHPTLPPKSSLDSTPNQGTEHASNKKQLAEAIGELKWSTKFGHGFRIFPKSSL